MTHRQREILIGLLLGDGHLETQNQRRTYRLKVEHSLKQKQYTEWLCNQYHEWILTPPQKKIQIVRYKNYSKIWFNTISHAAFRFYAHQFYKNRNKIVPKQIDKWLTPLGLAVWFMDDGSYKSLLHRDLILNTQCFSDKSLKILQEALLKNFSLKTTLRKQKEGKQILFNSKEADKLRKIISPFIISSMKYKLGNITPKR